jgi:Zn-dependent protease
MGHMDFGFAVQKLALLALPLLFAVTLHEAGHGYMALRKGDKTAWMVGRVTLNPIKHIDPVGTILVPLTLLILGASFLFGWAKPVPVNFRNLNRPREDMVWVAAAGPGMNLLLAVGSALACHAILLVRPELTPALSWPAFAIPHFTGAGGFSFFLPLLFMLKLSVELNVLLALFNLLPIPPLDGGRIAVGLLPRGMAGALAQVEPVGMFLVIALVWFDPGGFMRAYFWPSISTLSHWILVG